MLGLLVGGVGLAGLPLALYLALGRFVPDRLVLAGVWLVSLVPVGAFLLVVLLLTAALVNYPPGAYECPV